LGLSVIAGYGKIGDARSWVDALAGWTAGKECRRSWADRKSVAWGPESVEIKADSYFGRAHGPADETRVKEYHQNSEKGESIDMC